MGHNLVPGVLGELEALGHCAHGVASVGVPRNVLVDALHANLQARAAVLQHRADVWFEAVVWSRLDGDSDALLLAVLAVPHSLGDRLARVSAQRVVQVPDEVVAVLLVQTHERAAHHDELDLIAVVAQSLELVDSASRLQVRVVARANCTHARRLVPSVRLRRVLKVGIWSSGAVHANVPLGYNCNYQPQPSAVASLQM